MSDIFTKLGSGIADFVPSGSPAPSRTPPACPWKIQKILATEKPLGEPFVEGLSTVVADVESLIASSSAAVTASSLNFSADTQTAGTSSP